MVLPHPDNQAVSTRRYRKTLPGRSVVGFLVERELLEKSQTIIGIGKKRR
jgi:hypothetical protein